MAGFSVTRESGGTRASKTSIGIRAFRIGIAIIDEFRALVDIGAYFPVSLESRFACTLEVSWSIGAIGICRAISESQRAFVFGNRIAPASGT
jgi:hypothetical protein